MFLEVPKKSLVHEQLNWLCLCVELVPLTPATVTLTVWLRHWQFELVMLAPIALQLA